MRTSTQRVGPGQPGDHGEPVAEGALHGAEPGLERTVGRQPGGREQPRGLVEDTEVLGHRAAVRVRVDQRRAASAAGEHRGQRRRHRRASGRAGGTPDRDDPPGVVRLGRQVGVVGRLGLEGRPVHLGLEQIGQPLEVVGTDEYLDTDPRGAGAAGLGVDTHRHHTDLMTMEHVDRGRVQARRVEGDDGSVGLTRAAGREELVDVDAPLEHDHPAAGADQLQDRRLPRPLRRPRPGRRSRSAPADDGERGVVGRGEQPEEPLRLATGHAQDEHPRCRRSRTPRPPAGASSTVTPARTGWPSHTEEAWHAGASRGPEVDVDRVADPDARRYLIGRHRDRHLALVAIAAGRDGCARQQLTGAHVTAQPQVGRQLFVGAEVERRTRPDRRTGPGVRRDRRR